MTLWGFLDICHYDQALYIYLMNDYGEYLPVYHGTKENIDFWDDEVFGILQNEIDSLFRNIYNGVLARKKEKEQNKAVLSKLGIQLEEQLAGGSRLKLVGY